MSRRVRDYQAAYAVSSPSSSKKHKSKSSVVEDTGEFFRENYRAGYNLDPVGFVKDFVSDKYHEIRGKHPEILLGDAVGDGEGLLVELGARGASFASGVAKRGLDFFTPYVKKGYQAVRDEFSRIGYPSKPRQADYSSAVDSELGGDIFASVSQSDPFLSVPDAPVSSPPVASNEPDPMPRLAPRVPSSGSNVPDPVIPSPVVNPMDRVKQFDSDAGVKRSFKDRDFNPSAIPLITRSNSKTGVFEFKDAYLDLRSDGNYTLYLKSTGQTVTGNDKIGTPDNQVELTPLYAGAGAAAAVLAGTIAIGGVYYLPAGLSAAEQAARMSWARANGYYLLPNSELPAGEYIGGRPTSGRFHTQTDPLLWS